MTCSGALALLPAARAAMPWYEKKPAEWSPTDIDIILNRSGWTRQASPEVSADAISSADGKDGQRDNAAVGLRDKRTLPGFKVLVRCESALPVRLARRKSAPKMDATHYLFSVSRVPLALLAALSSGATGHGTSKEAQDPAELTGRIAQYSSLEREGKGVIHADQAYWSESDFESRIMISFPKGRQPIELTDREVIFVSRIGDLIVRAPFFLKEMVYRGNLEV